MADGTGDVYVFIDESGNFDFSARGTRYFILTAVVTADPVQGAHRLLGWRHHILTCGPEVLKAKRPRDCTHFHCAEDSQYTRDGVFGIISALLFEAYAVAIQKNKTHPKLQSPEDIYQHAFGGLIKGILRRKTIAGTMHIFAAEFKTKTKRGAFLGALKHALAAEKGHRYQIYFHPSQSHHMLQVSDYVSWAIARKWETGDLRSHAIVSSKIIVEFDYFRRGKTLFY